MLTPGRIVRYVNDLICSLVETGLADDQRFAFQRTGRDDVVQVTFEKAEHVSVALKDQSYEAIYQHLVQERAYNLRMLDGALIQMMYVFDDAMLQLHWLAFLSAPHLDDFQNNPEIYLNDEIYADIVARNIVPVPLRFDYDARDGRYRELVHPKTHLTLGQYERCRIPLTAPMTPFWFINFILRNFYHTAFARYADRLPTQEGAFAESIFPIERSVVHLAVPR